MHLPKCHIVGVIGIAVMVAVAGTAGGAVVMDQIGSSASFTPGSNAYTSQIFESTFASSDTAVVDDFAVGSPYVLTNVSAAVDGFSGFTSFSDVNAYDVEIYSSLAAASTSITGDVYNHSFSPADVTLTTPYGSDTDGALVSIATDIALPAAGTYYVAVLADNSFHNNGEFGVYATTSVSNATPGGLNAYQSNPGGGFGFSSNPYPLDLNAAYAISGTAASATTVPEPTSTLMVVGGMFALSRQSRAKRQSVV